MIKVQETGVMKVEPAGGSTFVKNISAGFVKLPGAIARLMADPPMTDQFRFKQNLAEARARIDWLSLR